MEKRRFVFDNYDTAAHGWTLAEWQLGPPERKSYYVDKPGGDGSWDMSTVLTDGVPRYNDRPLTVRLECSEGDRLSREAMISQMVNQLDGFTVRIEFPDDPAHYMEGALQVKREYNDLAHAAVTVTATCGPWKHSAAETVVSLKATGTEAVATVVNNGRRVVTPVITVTDNHVILTYGASTQTFTPGTYQWAVLSLKPGAHALKYKGSGSVKLTYREAVLE